MGVLTDLYQHFKGQRLLDQLDRLDIDLGQVEESLAGVAEKFGTVHEQKARQIVAALRQLAEKSGDAKEGANDLSVAAEGLRKRVDLFEKLHPLLLGRVAQSIRTVIAGVSAMETIRGFHTAGREWSHISARLSESSETHQHGFLSSAYEAKKLDTDLRAALRRHQGGVGDADALRRELLQSVGSPTDAARIGKRLIRIHAVYGGSLSEFWSLVQSQSAETGETIDGVLDSWVDVYEEQQGAARAIKQSRNPSSRLPALAREDFLAAARDAASQVAGFETPLADVALQGARAARAAAQLDTSYASTLQLVKDLHIPQVQANPLILTAVGRGVAQDALAVVSEISGTAAVETRRDAMRAALLGFVQKSQVERALVALEAYERGERGWSAEELGRLTRLTEDGSQRYFSMLSSHFQRMGKGGALQMLTQQLGSATRAHLVWSSLRLQDYDAAQRALVVDSGTARMETQRVRSTAEIEQEMVGLSTTTVTSGVARALQAAEHPLVRAATLIATLGKTAIGPGFLQRGQMMVGFMRSAVQYGLAAGVSPWKTRAIMVSAGLQSALAKLKDRRFQAAMAGTLAVGAQVYSKYSQAATPEPPAPSPSEAEKQIGMEPPAVTPHVPGMPERPRRIEPNRVAVPAAVDRQAGAAPAPAPTSSAGGIPFVPMRAANPDLELEAERAARQQYNERMKAVYSQLSNPLELLAFRRVRGSMGSVPGTPARAPDRLAIDLGRLAISTKGLPRPSELLRTIGSQAESVGELALNAAGRQTLGDLEEFRATEGVQAFNEQLLAAMGTKKQAGVVTLEVPGFAHELLKTR